MAQLPESVARPRLLPLIEALGLVPEEIAELRITPTQIVVRHYDIDAAGRIEVDDEGRDVVVHETEIPISG